MRERVNMVNVFNTFFSNVTFLYVLKTENLMVIFSGGIEMLHWKRVCESNQKHEVVLLIGVSLTFFNLCNKSMYCLTRT